MKLSYSKPFHNTLNYASTANIEEVTKFYNPGDKTFETDFKYRSNNLLSANQGSMYSRANNSVNFQPIFTNQVSKSKLIRFDPLVPVQTLM